MYRSFFCLCILNIYFSIFLFLSSGQTRDDVFRPGKERGIRVYFRHQNAGFRTERRNSSGRFHGPKSVEGPR